MAEYCEEFRKIEAQIYDIAFVDRVEAFVGKIYPPQAATQILNAGTLQEGKMEYVYQRAPQWATNYRIAGNSSSGSSRHSRHNRHNPHVDWKLCSLEFNKGGRRYMLWGLSRSLGM